MRKQFATLHDILYRNSTKRQEPLRKGGRVVTGRKRYVKPPSEAHDIDKILCAQSLIQILLIYR